METNTYQATNLISRHRDTLPVISERAYSPVEVSRWLMDAALCDPWYARRSHAPYGHWPPRCK
jgi:hypothetical protein